MIRSISKLATAVVGKPATASLFKIFARATRKLASYAHRLQMEYEWMTPPQPEWYDHFGDQFYQFRQFQNPLWVERGTFGLLAIKQGASVLELCCGDGFNAYHFYSIRADKIIAVDFDQQAIAHAKKYNRAANVEFRLSDIRTEMPEGAFDNIVWDGAIEHFKEEEIDKLLRDIKQRLRPNGVLTGYSIVELPTGAKSLTHHEREFRSKEDLKSFLEPHFKRVKVFETIYPVRHNLYFYASDGVLPFDREWESMTSK